MKVVKTKTKAKEGWYVYVLSCSDGTLYTGVTTNLKRRLTEHNSSSLGAKYTRARQPVSLAYSEVCKNRSEAQQREAAIKKLKRTDKESLIAS